jgi:hypothetical protein
MSLKSNQKPELLRRSRNQEIIKRMKQGEPLSSFSSADSWFPPRPRIEKDPEAVKRLYGNVDERLIATRQKEKDNDSNLRVM